MALHQKLFFLLLALLPTQLGFHFWPDWAYVLGRRVDYLSPTIYFTDILVILLLITWFFGQHNKFSTKPIILFFPFIAINIFFATSQPVAIYKWIKVLEFVGLGFYVIKTKPNVSRVTYYLSLGVLYSSIIAILQFVFQHSIGLWIIGERTFSADTPGIARAVVTGREFLRPYATFPHPNVLGGFLAVTLPLLIFNFQFEIFNQKKKFSIFKATTIILAVITLLLTFSRGAWIAALLSFAILKKKFILPIFLILLIFLFSFDVNEESIVVRNDLNSAAIAMWQTSPVFGVGLGNFLVELPKYLVSRDVYFLQPVHNIYLLILAETGIIGLVAFIWIIMRSFKKFNLSLFVLLFIGLVDHHPITLQQGQLLLTVLFSMSFYHNNHKVEL